MRSALLLLALLTPTAATPGEGAMPPPLQICSPVQPTEQGPQIIDSDPHDPDYMT